MTQGVDIAIVVHICYELGTVVSVEAVLGGYPYHVVVVLIKFIYQAARQSTVGGKYHVLLSEAQQR
jgi:hypothetical protein